MADDNLTYYRRRYAEEVEAARTANCAAAANRHQQLADRYAALAGSSVGDDSIEDAPLTER